MAKQRMINTRFWNDGFIVNLSWQEKLLFIYLLTNDKTNISGVYEVPISYMVFETGLEKTEVVSILKKFSDAGKIRYIDGWVGIKNFIKYQASNPKIMAGISHELSFAPIELIEFIEWQGIVRKKPTRAKLSRAVRTHVLKMGGYRCTQCGKGEKEKVILEIDHIKPVSMGGDNSLSNLRVLCQQCNGKRNADLRWGPQGWELVNMGGLSHSNSNLNSNSNLKDTDSPTLSYGEFQKVRLTEEEYKKLIEKIGEKNTNLLIRELDEYIAGNPKGKKYLNHYAVIQTWARRKYSELKAKSLPKTRTLA